MRWEAKALGVLILGAAAALWTRSLGRETLAAKVATREVQLGARDLVWNVLATTAVACPETDVRRCLGRAGTPRLVYDGRDLGAAAVAAGVATGAGQVRFLILRTRIAPEQYGAGDGSGHGAVAQDGAGRATIAVRLPTVPFEVANVSVDGHQAGTFRAGEPLLARFTPDRQAPKAVDVALELAVRGPVDRLLPPP